MTPERVCKVRFNAKFKSRDGVWRWMIRSENGKQNIKSEYAYLSERAAALSLINYLNGEAKRVLTELEALSNGVDEVELHGEEIE